MELYIGIDVGKYTLDVCINQNQYTAFKNTDEGLNELLKYLRKSEGRTNKIIVVVFEPTGGYEQGLKRALAEALISYYVGHPNKIRDFAKSKGYLAKTDKLDAKILCDYAKQSDLRKDKAELSKEQVRLKHLLSRREQLQSEKIREHNRLDKLLDDYVQDSIEVHIAWLKEQIDQIMQEIHQHIDQYPSLKSAIELYQSVKGVGLISAAYLIAHVPELGKEEHKQISALVGVAPMNRDSGRKRGKRMIKGGRLVIRKVIYMATLSAIRSNDDIKKFYQQLRQRGKPAKVAITAAMRKLMIVLNSVAKRGTPWQINIA
jgi:transposase